MTVEDFNIAFQEAIENATHPTRNLFVIYVDNDFLQSDYLKLWDKVEDGFTNRYEIAGNEVQLIVPQEMSPLEQQIVELRKEGLTYRAIQLKLGNPSKDFIKQTLRTYAPELAGDVVPNYNKLK